MVFLSFVSVNDNSAVLLLCLLLTVVYGQIAFFFAFFFGVFFFCVWCLWKDSVGLVSAFSCVVFMGQKSGLVITNTAAYCLV